MASSATPLDENNGKIAAFYPISPVLTRREDSSSKEEFISPQLPPSASSPSLISKVTYIPRNIFSICKDPQWMALACEIMGVASQACETSGGNALEAVPFLSLVLTPLYLSHAIKNAYQRLKLVGMAVKAHSVAMVVFNFGRALDSVGTAVGNVTKSLSGGFEIVGMGQVVATGLFFTLILPIILIVVGAIGGVMQGCSLWRNARTLKKYNDHAKDADHNVKALLDMIDYMQGPKVGAKNNVDHLAQAQFKLEKQNFKDLHFTNQKRNQAIQEKIENFLVRHDLHLVNSIREKILVCNVQVAIQSQIETLKVQQAPPSNEIQSALQLLERIQAIFQTLLTRKESQTGEMIDEIVELSSKVETLFSNPLLQKVWEKNPSTIQELLKEIKNNSNALNELKKDLLEEGGEIISLGRSEIHRAIFMNSISLLIACLVFTAGVLSLTSSHYHLISLVLALSSSGLTVSSVLFDKTLSQDKFHRLHVFFQ